MTPRLRLRLPAPGPISSGVASLQTVTGSGRLPVGSHSGPQAGNLEHAGSNSEFIITHLVMVAAAKGRVIVTIPGQALWLHDHGTRAVTDSGLLGWHLELQFWPPAPLPGFVPWPGQALPGSSVA